MYVYSPTLLDSQVLSSQTCKKNYLASSTRTSTQVTSLSPVTTILTKATWVANGEWRCGKNFPGCTCRGPGSTIMRKMAAFCQWKWRGISVWLLPQLGQLLLCFGKGGFLQWRMENVVLDLSPGSWGCGVSPCFTCVLGGQCSNGDDNGRRK